jgi:hypothetical protein
MLAELNEVGLLRWASNLYVRSHYLLSWLAIC